MGLVLQGCSPWQAVRVPQSECVLQGGHYHVSRYPETDHSLILVAEFVSPQRVHTLSSMGDHSIPKNVKCARSATKIERTDHIIQTPSLVHAHAGGVLEDPDLLPPGLSEGLGFRVWGLGFRVWGFGFRVLGRLADASARRC